MLTNATHLKGVVIRATDGEIGTVDQLYFDDETWAIRYLVIETRGWLGGRRVLISPISVVHTDWQAKRLDVALTKRQVENSPDINTDKLVSRQHEAAYLGHYGYPNYWGDRFLWGSGYHIEASDGEIGHVHGFVFDDEDWAVRYIEVLTRNWWPGKRVLVSPAWIQQVSWAQSKVYVGLFRDAIKTAPEFFESRPITRDYEGQLYHHYGRPPYWLHDAEYKSAFSQSGV